MVFHRDLSWHQHYSLYTYCHCVPSFPNMEYHTTYMLTTPDYTSLLSMSHYWEIICRRESRCLCLNGELCRADNRLESVSYLRISSSLVLRWRSTKDLVMNPRLICTAYRGKLNRLFQETAEHDGEFGKWQLLCSYSMIYNCYCVSVMKKWPSVKDKVDIDLGRCITILSQTILNRFWA